MNRPRIARMRRAGHERRFLVRMRRCLSAVQGDVYRGHVGSSEGCVRDGGRSSLDTPLGVLRAVLRVFVFRLRVYRGKSSEYVLQRFCKAVTKQSEMSRRIRVTLDVLDNIHILIHI